MLVGTVACTAHKQSYLSQVCSHAGHLCEYIVNKLEHYSWGFFLTFPFHLVSKDSTEVDDMKCTVQHTPKTKGQMVRSTEVTLVSLVLVSA